jgi:hypothetical protein
LLTNCTKRETEGIGKIADPQFEGPPPSIPTLTMNSPSYYDQFSRLSIGLASMFGDTAVCNGADLLDNLTDLVNTQQNRPARMAAWYANLNGNGFQFKLPTTSADHYDCLAHRIQNISTPTTPNPWMTDFYQYFNVVGSASLHYVELGIPDYEDQVPGNLNKPVLVMPDPEIIRTPELSNILNAYYWNQGAARIDTIVLDDIDDYYDLLELSDYFIVTVSYDIENTQVMTLINDCSEGYTVDDGYCDGNCGETVANSPNDCAQEKNKILYFRKLRINEDFKERGGAYLYEKRHWEALTGNQKYEPEITLFHKKNNGKIVGRTHLPLEYVSFTDVKRTRRKMLGSTVSRGNSVWINALTLNAVDDEQRVVLDLNYNPNSDETFFSIMEFDKRKSFSIDYRYGSTTIASVTVRSLSMTASKWANTLGASNSIHKYNHPWYDYVPCFTCDSTLWHNETLNLGGDSEPARVFKRNTGNLNTVDYEIYYLRNRRGWGL